MSWQNNWGTVKSTTAKTCALYHEVSNVGKTFEGSKKRVTWRIKVEEGKEYEISLTHSLTSGKKVLRVDGIVKYTAKALSFGDWDYVFNLSGGHVVHIIIKPSVDLNDMYDLIIDNVSFRRLPDRLDNGSATRARPVTLTSDYRSTTAANNSRGSANAGTRTGSSHTNSFTPWECTRCTLINEKPLAPVCEACGNPKPDYISPATAARVQATLDERSASRGASQVRMQSMDKFVNEGSTFNPFGDEAATAFGSTMSAPPTTFSPAVPAKEDFSSMLSGLDFSQPLPLPPTQVTSPPELVQPQPTHTPANTQTANGDLWSSSMVDLNLSKKPQKVATADSWKQRQTLEQARRTTSTTNMAKVPVMPLPAPMPTTAMTNGFYATAAPAYYQQGGMQPGVYMHGAGTPGYGATPAGPYPGGVMPSMPQNAFMTAAAAPPNRPPAFYSSDPFATLS